MTVEQLIRTHRELALMMGFTEATRGTETYSYQILMNDMNTLHPHIVGSINQMKRAMVGQIVVPAYWEKILDELLSLAVNAQQHPPTPGPFWHPQPMNAKQRRLAALKLIEWQAYYRSANTEVAQVAEMSARRISLIRHGKVAILPTELDRLASAFGTDVGAFLQGPKRKEGL